VSIANVLLSLVPAPADERTLRGVTHDDYTALTDYIDTATRVLPEPPS